MSKTFRPTLTLMFSPNQLCTSALNRKTEQVLSQTPHLVSQIVVQMVGHSHGRSNGHSHGRSPGRSLTWSAWSTWAPHRSSRRTMSLCAPQHASCSAVLPSTPCGEDCVTAERGGCVTVLRGALTAALTGLRNQSPETARLL